MRPAISFKAANGWIEADAAAHSLVYAAVVHHVQACYALEREVAGKIVSGEITTTAEIDAAFVE